MIWGCSDWCYRWHLSSHRRSYNQASKGWLVRVLGIILRTLQHVYTVEFEYDLFTFMTCNANGNHAMMHAWWNFLSTFLVMFRHCQLDSDLENWPNNSLQFALNYASFWQMMIEYFHAKSVLKVREIKTAGYLTAAILSKEESCDTFVMWSLPVAGNQKMGHNNKLEVRDEGNPTVDK